MKNNLLQNMKSGFANVKELFGIFLSDDGDIVDTYDLYINSSDRSLAETAKQLKIIEEEQEASRLSLLGSKEKSISKKRPSSKELKKNFKSENKVSKEKTTKSRSSHRKRTGDDHILDKQPEK